jgi:eukaryotic-like serine/threonine-protein kinase
MAEPPAPQPLTPAPRTSPTTGALVAGETLPSGDRTEGPAVRQVGRYLIQERIGRGGMATVFKAHDPGIGRDVAIKFLHAAMNADDEQRARFLREARAAGGLAHPNIVTVYDVGEIDGRPYMAMELLDGAVLSDELRDGARLPVRETVVMAIQLARAMDYAHARGVVHRDIKPGNIMRLRGTKTIKVTDFGIAHVDALSGTTSDVHTHAGDILGTPQYMSPEQAQGAKLDGRSDLFSAGILMYQMLTGRRPFEGDSLVAIAMKIANEEPTPLDKLRADVPPALRRIIERCLAKPRERRFQTGKELSEALTRVLGEIDAAEREKNTPRIVPLRVKWAATMALIVAAVMAITATIVTQRQYAAMVAQATDYGAALARFIAAQNAVPALAEDWVAVDVTLQEIMKARNFQGVSVIDNAGVVRAASQAALVGKPYVAPAGQAPRSRPDGVTVERHVAGGEDVLGFEAPILFQDKRVGRVALALPERPLTEVARLSAGLMALLVLVTVLAVAIATYFVANWFAQPIKLVAESMREIARGRFEHRIREARRDEFGLLYGAFDEMAQALQDRQAGAAPRGPSTVTLTGGRAGSAAPVPSAAPTSAPLSAPTPAPLSGGPAPRR